MVHSKSSQSESLKQEHPRA